MSDPIPFFGRHEKVALSFSGGKDSLAVVYMLRPYLDRLCIYHLDTGDLLPEMRESVSHVERFAPNFVRVNTDVTSWIEKHGLPTDLMPHSSHPIGQAMGEHKTRLVSRYDCCAANLMGPIYKRIKEDGNTLLIRGTKAVDMNTLPVRTGDVADDGVEFWYPLEKWSNQDVFDYLRAVDAPMPRIYAYQVNSPECARCSAWWGEGRATYLSMFHPELYRQYDARLQLVIEEVAGPLANLRREAGVE